MKRRTHVLVTIGAATLLGLAAPAVATETDTASLGSAAGVRYVMGTVQLEESASPTRAVKGAGASCSRGWKAVGGGLSINARSQQGIKDVYLGQERYWYVAAWQRDAPESRLSTFTVCMRTDQLSSGTTVVSNIPADAPVTEAVMCTEGSAVSGGLMSNGEPSDFALNASYPIDGGDPDTVPDDGWRSYVDYTGDGSANIHFSVRCLSDTDLSYRGTVTDVAPGATVSARTLCPKGSPVVGGGVYVTGGSHLSHVVASRPWDSKDAKKVPEDGWRGGIVNTSAIELSMTVHAVCRDSAVL